MIIFVPEYDEQTRMNGTIIRQLISQNDTVLIGTDAIKDRLIHELCLKNDSLFVMNHGEYTYFEDNNNEIAISTENSHHLAQRNSFIYACKTARKLGYLMMSEHKNAIYWGYDVPISGVGDEYVKIFDFILQNFSFCNNESDIQNVLDELKVICETSSDKAALDGDLETLTGLYQLWARLRVFYQHKILKHSESPDFDPFE